MLGWVNREPGYRVIQDARLSAMGYMSQLAYSHQEIEIHDQLGLVHVLGDPLLRPEQVPGVHPYRFQLPPPSPRRVSERQSLLRSMRS